MNPELRYSELLELAKNDPNILGFFQSGSRGKGMITEHSDWDFDMIVKDEVAEEYKKKYGIWSGLVECGVSGITEFTAYAAWGGPFAWDRYNFTHCKALVDKTETIQKIINEKGRVPENEVKKNVSHGIGAYINALYRSQKCFRDGKSEAAQLEAAEGVPYFLQAIFGVYGRIRPYNKYLKWELEQYPLKDLPWTPDEFVKILITILKTVDLKIQHDLFEKAEVFFREKGYGFDFDDWGEKLPWIRSYVG